MATPITAPDSSSAPADRPTGVTVLAVLSGIAAVFTFVAAMGAMALGALGGSFGGDAGGVFAIFGAIAGVVLLVLAVVYAAAAYGLWTRKRWGWYLAAIGAAIQLLQGLASLLSLELVSAVFGLAIGGLVAWYLLSPAVQRWFGLSYKTPWTYKA